MKPQYTLRGNFQIKKEQIIDFAISLAEFLKLRHWIVDKDSGYCAKKAVWDINSLLGECNYGLSVIKNAGSGDITDLRIDIAAWDVEVYTNIKSFLHLAEPYMKKPFTIEILRNQQVVYKRRAEKSLLFLYLISSTAHIQWDMYESAVVVARSEKEARQIHPDGKVGEHCWTDRGSWAAPHQVMVHQIGVAKEDLKENEVICSSFHSG